ncbi:MAG: SIS domain-containing protein [Proteobacteria bacterium]|nr:SIS domain-containing protein [Pseudomonadota bacterium]
MEVILEIKDYFRKIEETISKLNLQELEDFYNLLFNCYERGSQIFVFGNGGSASTASHFATDLNKGVCFGLDKRFKIICLNESIPSMLAYANDLSYSDIFVEQLKNYLQKDDVVIGISGSGNSENVIKAIEYANGKGAITVGITGYDGGMLKKVAKYSVNANVNDMQISEDFHLIFFHIIMKLFNKNLKGLK